MLETHVPSRETGKRTTSQFLLVLFRSLFPLIHSLPISVRSHAVSDQEQSHTLLWPLRTHRNLIFLQTSQLGPWESDLLLDPSQDQQWHFRVGATQILASLCPSVHKNTTYRGFKDQLCPWEGLQSPGILLPAPVEAQQGGSSLSCLAKWSPKVPVRAVHGRLIKVQVQLDHYLRFRWKGLVLISCYSLTSWLIYGLLELPSAFFGCWWCFGQHQHDYLSLPMIHKIWDWAWKFSLKKKEKVICCMAQETKTGALNQPRRLGWEGGSKGRGYMYTYGWLTLRFDRKQQNSVNLLSFNKK